MTTTEGPKGARPARSTFGWEKIGGDGWDPDICIACRAPVPQLARGLCKRCYERHKRQGTFDGVALPDRRRAKPIDRALVKRCDETRDRWLATPWDELGGHLQDRFIGLLEVLGPEACQSILGERD